MENVVAEEGKPRLNGKRRRWYNSYIFPLIPTLTIKHRDQYNTSGFTFKWMFLTIWTLDSFCFEFALVVSEHWGIGVTAIIPYLRIVFVIPCPQSFESIFRKLSRS